MGEQFNRFPTANEPDSENSVLINFSNIANEGLWDAKNDQLKGSNLTPFTLLIMIQGDEFFVGCLI